MRKLGKSLLMLGALLMLVLPVLATGGGETPKPEGGKSYPDGHGGEVYFPLGDQSFADEYVSFTPGDPMTNDRRARTPANTEGAPDYDGEHNYLTLGCKGTLVMAFRDNALVDVEGPDLYVFEIGPAVEPTYLSISQDGETWVDVGKISGGRADVDIAEFTEPGQVFHYVSLTDAGSDCGSRWPGADIDAVGAIGAGVKLTLDGSVLFDSDKAVLKARAKEVISGLLQEKGLKAATVYIEGHTDSQNTDEHNMDLSRRRAEAVRDYLKTQSGMEEAAFEIRAYGESRPVADNASAEGRAKNRRVELIIIPR